MSNTDTILEFLEARQPSPVCDDCISRQLGIEPRQQVNQICRRLAAQGQIVRGRDRCGACGRTKESNTVALVLPPTETTAVRGVAVYKHVAVKEGELSSVDIREMRDHIIRFGRQLWKAAKREETSLNGLSLVAAVRDEGLVPAHQANMMMTICGLRNAFSYDKIQIGNREADIATAAWDIITAWAAKAQADLWRQTTR